MNQPPLARDPSTPRHFTQEEETPQKQFKGWWIPAVAVLKFEAGEINAMELLLLATIDSYAKHKEGCFASNTFLGEKLNLSADRISRMISHLTDIGLVVTRRFDGRRRWLDTCWSAPPDDDRNRSVTRQHRRIHLGCEGGITEADEEESPRRISIQTTSQVKIPSPNGEGARKRAAPPKRSSVREDLHSSSFDRQAAGRLREILIKYDSDLVAPQPPKRGVGIDALAASIRRLRVERSVPEEEIEAMLVWLREHYGDDYVPKLRKKDDLYTQWGRFKEARRRWEADRRQEQGIESEDEEQESRTAARKEEAAGRVADKMWGDGQENEDWVKKEVTSDRDWQPIIDRFLAEMGYPAGFVTPGHVRFYRDRYHRRREVEVDPAEIGD